MHVMHSAWTSTVLLYGFRGVQVGEAANPHTGLLQALEHDLSRADSDDVPLVPGFRGGPIASATQAAPHPLPTWQDHDSTDGEGVREGDVNNVCARVGDLIHLFTPQPQPPQQQRPTWLTL